MISAVSASSGGISTALQSYATAAEGVAAIGTSLPAAAQIDLSATALQLIGSKADVGLNTAILKSSLETDRKVLDILA
ncbi:hypothetical protein G3T14_13255 [Methylobacterium sp. BTF04]|uniref:hypothetical protein n=1 Tax=Methylobacterium sp. BTF04 TaxID=2708300 RepID=UPI0013D4871A|nr:hypothetical protein [Methylobacterium sp. BTF04]NEU13100.1 hypothetical protein [Methylobacterium sp. BTF04]